LKRFESFCAQLKISQKVWVSKRWLRFVSCPEQENLNCWARICSDIT
jgi:hypothetical protein